MKKIKGLLVLIAILLNLICIVKTNAIDCHPAYDGNWTVTENCDWPDGYKVDGNIYVGAYTISMGANDDMGIDLDNDKITFSTGKIDLNSTAKIANHVSSRYYISVNYSTVGTGTDCDTNNGGNQCTACPAGMFVFNSTSVPNMSGTTSYVGTSPVSVASTGTLYCGTQGT